jgi:hypothetical protein
MKSLLAAATLASLSSLAPSVRAASGPPPERVQPLSMPGEGPSGGAVTAQPTRPAQPPDDEPPPPRLKLSYMGYGMGDGDGGTIPLQALHLDMYPLSWRYVRFGVEAEAGRGRGKVVGQSGSVNYGLLGVNLGLRLPRRISPFVEGRLAAGVLAARVDGAFMIPGTPISVNGATGATWMVTRGIDLGLEVYTFRRGFVSASVGWARTTWRTADFDVQDRVTFKNVSHDAFLFKIGLGL